MSDRPNILSSTLRERRRYLVFEVLSKDKVDFADVKSAMWNSFLNFLGEIGTAKANINIVKDSYDEKSKIGILSCNHISIEEVRSALSMISKINDVPIIISVKGISGSIKTAKQKFFGERNLESFI